MKNFFVYALPCKPYICQYLKTQFGNPVWFNPKSHFGMIVYGLLMYPHRLKEKQSILEHRVVDKFTGNCDVKLNVSWAQEYRYGFNMRDTINCNFSFNTGHIITLNKLLEEQFANDMHRFCVMYNLSGREIKEAIEHFCIANQIQIEHHITYETLKQKEYRQRKKNEDILDKLFYNGLKNQRKEKINQYFELLNTSKNNPPELSRILMPQTRSRA